MKRSFRQRIYKQGDEKSNDSKLKQKDIDNPLQINKTLQNTKANILEFLNNLTSNQKEPVDFTIQFQQICNIIAQDIIDHIKLMQLVDNTIRKMKNNKKLKKNWNKQDLTILLYMIEKYNLKTSKKTQQYQQNDWEFISTLIPGKNPSQCMFKWLSLKKNNLNEFPWTEEEEFQLLKLVKQIGTNKWLQVSQRLYSQQRAFKTYRSPKQCRQHWTCYMDPKLKKGPWTQQQDLELLKLFVRIGKKWSQISKLLNGRTQNAVKNRFNLIMQKQEKIQGKYILSNLQYAQQLIVNLQISLPLTHKPIYQQSYYNQDQKQNPFIDPSRKNQQQNKNIQKIDTQVNKVLQQFSSSNNSQSSQKSNLIKVIKFKKMSLNELMKIDGIIPATYNKNTMQIVCKDIYPLKINEMSQSSSGKQSINEQCDDARSDIVRHQKQTVQKIQEY